MKFEDINDRLKTLSFEHNPHLDNVFEHIYYEFRMFLSVSELMLDLLGKVSGNVWIYE